MHGLAEQIGEVLDMAGSEAVDRAKVGLWAGAGQVAQSQIPAQSPGDLSPAVHRLRGREQPQLEQQPRGVGVLAVGRIALLESRQIQVLDHVVDEKHRIGWIQRLAQMSREQLPLILLVLLEPLRRAHDGAPIPATRKPCAVLSRAPD